MELRSATPTSWPGRAPWSASTSLLPDPPPRTIDHEQDHDRPQPPAHGPGGQASSPAKASSGPDLGLGQHAKAVELSLQAKALRQEAEQLYQASFYLELEALEGCPPGAIHEYATRVLGAMYMGYRAKKFEAVVDLLDRARRNEPAFALVLREAESSFLAPFLRAVDHPEARVDFLGRLHRLANLPLDIPVAPTETPRISFG